MITVIVLVFYDNSDALLNNENISLWILILLSLHYRPLIFIAFSFYLSTAAPYSTRNLSDSTLIHYELDSKFCYVSVSQKHAHAHAYTMIQPPNYLGFF